MKKSSIVFCLSIFVFISCQQNRSGELAQINAATEISRLKQENEKLSLEYSNLKSATVTESKLTGKIEYNFTVQQYDLAKAYIQVYTDLFPNSTKLEQYKSYYDAILEYESASNEQLLLEQQKSMTDYTGIWTINNFVDSDNNLTNKTFISTNESLKGTFSTDSFINQPFSAQLIIENKNNVSLRIFEGTDEILLITDNYNPFKYNITITDSNDSTFTFTAKNTSDRISFGTSASSKLHNALLQGGTISFFLTKTNGSNATYYFEIPDAQFYNNACRRNGTL